MNKSETQSEAKVEPQPGSPAPSDLKPQIANRAYEIHEERGQQSDPAVQDWERAEKEIRKDQTKGELAPGGKTVPRSGSSPTPTPPRSSC